MNMKNHRIQALAIAALALSGSAFAQQTSGGLYSTSNEQNVNKVNPISGTTVCTRGYSAAPVLSFTAVNPTTGDGDQFSLTQCGGGFYSTSNQHNIDFVNPETGALKCRRQRPGREALVFNATNPITGAPDQFSLYQCDDVTGGTYSVSNQHNADQVNPWTGRASCAGGAAGQLALQFNAINPVTGTPDQFSFYQCL